LQLGEVPSLGTLHNASLQLKNPTMFASSWESLSQYRCPDWFRDAKFGIWAHWGP